ncbi:hypothetical protein [Agriterribacter sp.]|uniref:hypothetical protein n=1 Tax=Agriterribacter sp. TaxID=2821509 RepID=UPI002CF99D2F|nr:hypothetical protein [Agriterribacter sp.]HRP58097.1 hypothetical protein [Agriterribacter sp.]
MNIDQLKADWQRYHQKLELSQRLNEQLMHSMLKERSRSRVAKIRRDNMIYMILMMMNLVILTAIFAGNPFDFKYSLQYIPYGILTTGVLLALVSLFKSLQSFNVNLNHVDIERFLKKTITELEKSRKMERWFGTTIVAAGVLTALSFLPNKLQNKSPGQAWIETVIIMAVTVVIYIIAFKLGAFKNRKKEDFENDLKELNALKAIASELSDK